MAHDIRYDRRALADLQSIHDYIAERNPRAARRVIAAIERSIGHLSEHPLMGARERNGMGRILVVPRFGYLVSYALVDATEAAAEAVEIRYVLHPSRNR